MSAVDACPEHTERTQRRNLRYCFSFKHHGGSRDAAQWVSDLTHEDEFAIFDEADRHDISDDKGNLYGVRRDAALNLEEIGTFGEQIAKFWEADLNVPWHGFPLWHLKGPGPGGRATEFVSKDVLVRMVREGLLLPVQRKRLQKGDRV
jgi:hypothetical protein